MSAPILVTGASGQVGGHVLRALVERGVAVRALFRDPAKAEQARGELVEPVVGDFTDAEAMARALDGVQRVFLVSGPSPELPTVEAAAIEAFRAAGVEYVVKSSILAPDADAVPFRAGQAHAEEALRASGLPHAVLRPHYFTQNLLGSADVIRAKGVYEDAACGAPLSMVDLRDIGECAAALLTGEVRHGETFDLTGPEAVTGAQVAEAIGRVTGAEVTAVDLPPAELAGRLAGWGLPEWFAGALVALYEDYAASGTTGYAAGVSTAVQELTGHPARSVADFAADHADAFRPERG